MDESEVWSGPGKIRCQKKGPGLEVKEVLLQPTIKGPISNPGQAAGHFSAVATDSWTWSGATLGPSGHTRSTPTGFRCMGLTLSPTRNLFIGNWKRTGFGDPGFGSEAPQTSQLGPRRRRRSAGQNATRAAWDVAWPELDLSGATSDRG